MSRNPMFSPDSVGSGAPVPTVKPPNAFRPPNPASVTTAAPAAAPVSPPAGPLGPPPGGPTTPPLSESAQATKIRAFEQRLGGGQQSEAWKRPTNVSGQGATHLKSFHCKLSADALEFLDKQVNDWLDAHPDYEVKLVTTTVGDWTGKIREPALIVQVWV